VPWDDELGIVGRPTVRAASDVLVSLVIVVAMALATTAVSGDVSSASVTGTGSGAVSPQKAAMAGLLQSLNPQTGIIGSSWWQGAVALSAVETYQQVTGDTSYSAVIADAFRRNKSGAFENQADDDTAWWALAWLQAYDITGSRQYLAMAETDADYIHQAWDSTCGGGVWWVRTPLAYKNAIANELFLELAAWLHNTIPGDTKYLDWADAEWTWFQGSGMINSSNLVNDGLSDNCANNQQTTWTYNQGVILAGLAQLYIATGNASLLTEAERIARAAISNLTVRGVLTEPCAGAECGNDTGGNDQSFKGIFVQDLKVLAVTAKTSQFDSFFMAQARSIEASDTSASHQLGMFWAGPVADRSSAAQASAEDALVASLNLP
jgi:predicted alpha-1,6-mannanase (GH76 family)